MTTGWIEIFQAGPQKDSSGRKKTWTIRDLDRLVSTFNSRRLDVPIVIGHPKVNHPAWGWTSALKRVGTRLFARFKQVDKTFWKWVQEGRYKKRSIAVSGNRIVHVGWLGAMPPAVGGMSDRGLGRAAHAKEGRSRTYIFLQEAKMPKKGQGKGFEYAMIEDLEEALDKEKKKNRKLEKMMKGMKRKGRKDKKMLDSYSKFVAPKESKKRVSKRKKRVRALVENQKITPASEKSVLSYATALGRNIEKVSVGDKKRTLEEHFLRGLEQGDTDPIFREFAMDPDAADGHFLGEDEKDDLSVGEAIASQAGVKVETEGK